MKNDHISVLLVEAVEALVLNRDGIYVDATFGRGGHSKAILARLGAQGRLFAFDKDPEATSVLAEPEFQDPRFCFVPGSFSQMQSTLQQHGVLGQVDGVLLDLGVSSPQLDDRQRGFSFQQPGPLDMRMDPQTGISLGTWLQLAEEEEIAWVLKHYGEERYARRIAKAIKQNLALGVCFNTQSLATLIKNNVPHEKNKNPATRSFLAFRIFINRELDELQTVLAQSPTVLKHKGRLVVISFHSLEDRMVKHFIRGHADWMGVKNHREHYNAQRLLGAVCMDNVQFNQIGKAIKASHDEVEFNPRARSAIMRIAEKIV